MNPNAGRAIEILEPLRDQLGASYVAYWALPNVILTLSGARAYGDGVFWKNPSSKSEISVWLQEIKQAAAIIQENTPVLWSEVKIAEPRPGEKYAGYELLFESGMRYVLAHTMLLTETTLDRIKTQTTPPGISAVLVDDLRSQARFKDYSSENLEHVAFGILAGYPDEAITGSVLKWEEDDPFAEPLIEADIRGAGYYACPQPVYSYPRSFVNHPVIIAHEQAWSDILKQYYESDFHKSLEKDSGFQRKLEELGNLR